MDLAFSPSQQLLQQSARAFLQQRCPPERVQELALDPRGFAADLWKEIATLGWPGLLVPTELGGSGGSVGDALALVEELGRAVLPEPVHRERRRRDHRADRWPAADAPRRCSPPSPLGERICALAVLEESGRLDPDAVTLPVTAPGRLSGRKLFVPGRARGHRRDRARPSRHRAHRASCSPMDRAGISARPLDSMTGDKLFELELADVETREDDLLGAPGAAGRCSPPRFASAPSPAAPRWPAPPSASSSSAWSTPACACRAAAPSAATRPSSTPAPTSFATSRARAGSCGRPRGSSNRAAPTPTPRSPQPRPTAAEACLRVARRGHQIMGAIGYSEEHPLHLFHKRILAAGLDAGDATPHLETVALDRPRLRSSPLTDVADARPPPLPEPRHVPSQRSRGQDAGLVRGGGWEALRLHGGRIGQGQAPAPFVAGAVAPSDMRGHVRGEWYAATARLVTEPAVIERAHVAFGPSTLQMWIGDLFSRLTGQIRRRAWIEIEV